MEYTKGDWKAIYYDGSDCWGIQTEEHQICGLEPGHAASIWLSKEEHEANAYLIAAAPKMHEALKLVYNWIGGDKDEDEITSFIDSVLAKADNKEGGANDRYREVSPPNS